MTNHARKLPFARLALAACAAMPFAVGCEDEVASGDRQIRSAIEQSYAEANAADGSPAKAIPVLSEAAAVDPASPLYKAQAQALLGQANYTAAMQSIPELNTLDVRTGQLLRQISRLSSRILENTFGIEAMRGTNPAGKAPNEPLKTFAQSKEAFAKRIAELDKGIAEAQKNLEAKSAQLKDLEAKRLAAANQSTDLTLKSEESKGEESVKLYAQALEARQQASMLAHQIELANLDLVRLEQVVEGLKSQRQAAADGVKTAEQQVAQLDRGWGETQKLIQRQVEATKSIVTESGIASRADELAKVTAEAEALRKQVNENLSRAISAYEAADAAAVALDADLGTRIRENGEAAGRAAWESLQKTINPFTYDIARAKALFARAHVAMSERSLLDARRGLSQRVTPIFQQAQLELPAQLSGADLDKRIDELTTQAGADLKTAEEVLNDVIERAGDGNTQDQNAARFMQMAVQYASYHLGDNANALASAQDHLKALMQSSILLPSLPSDLEKGVVSRTVKPTTAPAAGGAGTGGTGEQSTWLKVLERASKPFVREGGPGGPGAPGTPPVDPNAPAPDNTQPVPDEQPEPARPNRREPGGSLAPPTGIDL